MKMSFVQGAIQNAYALSGKWPTEMWMNKADVLELTQREEWDDWEKVTFLGSNVHFSEDIERGTVTFTNPKEKETMRQEAAVITYIDWHATLKALEYQVENREIERVSIHDVKKIEALAQKLHDRLSDHQITEASKEFTSILDELRKSIDSKACNKFVDDFCEHVGSFSDNDSTAYFRDSKAWVRNDWVTSPFDYRFRDFGDFGDFGDLT